MKVLCTQPWNNVVPKITSAAIYSTPTTFPDTKEPKKIPKCISLFIFLHQFSYFAVVQFFSPEPSGTLQEPYLVVEEMNGVAVEFQWQRLQKGNVVGHDLLVGEVKFMHDDGVDVVIRQQVVCRKQQQNKVLSGRKKNNNNNKSTNTPNPFPD